MARLRRRGCRGASMRVATLSGCLSCGAHSCRIPGPLLRIRPLPPGANPPGGARQLQSPAIPSTWASDAQPTTRCCGGAGEPNYARPRRAVNGRRTKIFVRATADGGRVPAALRPGLRRNILSSSGRGNGCFASGEGCRRQHARRGGPAPRWRSPFRHRVAQHDHGREHRLAVREYRISVAVDGRHPPDVQDGALTPAGGSSRALPAHPAPIHETRGPATAGLSRVRGLARASRGWRQEPMPVPVHSFRRKLGHAGDGLNTCLAVVPA